MDNWNRISRVSRIPKVHRLIEKTPKGNNLKIASWNNIRGWERISNSLWVIILCKAISVTIIIQLIKKIIFD